MFININLIEILLSGILQTLENPSFLLIRFIFGTTDMTISNRFLYKVTPKP